MDSVQKDIVAFLGAKMSKSATKKIQTTKVFSKIKIRPKPGQRAPEDMIFTFLSHYNEFFEIFKSNTTP